MYLAGYAVECLLKKKLMEQFACRTLQDLEDELRQRGRLGSDSTIFMHHLESLLRLAGGIDRMRQNRNAWEQFKMVNQWVPAWRYSPDLASSEDAVDFLQAVDNTLHWIQANV
jgi:hypothetical protein